MNLSIIIPAYNVENYLSCCIDSCLNQDIDNYEIIIVNDGSTDHSLAIAESYKNKHQYIKIITQDNQGLSIARNNGLDIATGEYVWFVDSDDWIEVNCLNDIIKTLNREKPDIVQLQYQLQYEDGHKENVASYILNRSMNGKEILLKGGLPDPAQFCIFRKEFLNENHLRFYPNIYHEDSEFKPRATYFANSIISYNKIVYNYFQRSSGSITSSFKLKNAKDIVTVNQNLYEFSQSFVADNNIKKSIYRFISKNFNTLFLGIRQLNSEAYNETLNILKANRHLLKLMLKSQDIKYIIEGLAFTISIKFGLTLHKLIR